MTAHAGPWPAGTPCWVDLMVGDLERTKAFYTELLSWDYAEPRPEYGGYLNALVDGGGVAGLSPTMPGMEDTAKTWTIYLASDDITAVGTKIEGAGGHATMPPMDVGDQGRMGLWSDTTGATFGVWQSGAHTGFDVYDTPGTVAWCDLMTGDATAACDFYASVFDYSYTDAGMDDMTYVLFTPPGAQRPAGGIGQSSADDGGTPRSAWSVCFEVTDVDETTAKVPAAGGSVLQEPFDFQYGRLALAKGPDGEEFAIFTSSRA